MPGTDRVEIRTLKVGRFCVVDDEAYKILSISKSKPGKHGSAKARLSLESIFTKKKISHVGTVTDSINVPMIEKGTATVTHIDGAEVHAMNDKDFAMPRNEALNAHRFIGFRGTQMISIKHRAKALGNSASKLFAEMERGGFIRDEFMQPAGYKKRLRRFIDRLKTPNSVRIYALPFGFPLKRGDRASLSTRLGLLFTSNTLMLTVIEYDKAQDRVIKIFANGAI